MHCFAPFLLACTLAWCAPAFGQAEAVVRREGDAIVFSGRIEERAAERFLALAQDPAVKRVVITSAGGLVWPALDMADAIHARGLDVEVPEACFSSCANYIFPAGRRKLMDRAGVVAWHGNMAHVLYLQQTGQGSWNTAAIASAHVLARREAEFFRRIGVDGFVCWFGKIPPHNVDAFYALSVADMERFGIRGVRVRDPKPRAPGDGVPEIAPNWSLLPAHRPAVQLVP